MTAWLLLLLGLAVLVGGAELLVRGASGLAARLGISPLVIGLTIVAFGTSSPEIAVSLGAVANGQPDLALGNAVGSNTFNVLVILGLAAIIRPLIVKQQLLRFEVPLIVGAGIALWIMLLDGSLGRTDGALLFFGIVAYTTVVIGTTRREKPEIKEEYEQGVPPKPQHALLAVALIVGGLGLCVPGSRWLVQGAVTIAASLGVSELVIGLTIVAAGTSLPEVATSLVAAFKGQRDIAVGNVLGSNLFNILAILGLAGLVAPDGLPASPALMAFDLPVMIAVSVACLPILFTGYRVDRWEGLVFLIAYIAYVACLILSTTDGAAGGDPRSAVLWFAVPLIALGIVMSTLQARRNKRQRSGSLEHQNGDPR